MTCRNSFPSSFVIGFSVKLCSNLSADTTCYMALPLFTGIRENNTKGQNMHIH